MVKEDAAGPSITPLKLCCGSVSLFIGVLIICFIHVLMNVLLLAFSSSTEAGYVGNIKIAPFWQICASAWGLLGMPIIVLAGVASMFRIPWPLKIYLYYLVATVVMALTFIVEIFALADVCGSTVPIPVRNLGENFICSASNTIVFCMILMTIGLCMYAVWVVWSCEKQLSDPNAHISLMQPEEVEEEEADQGAIREKFRFSPQDQRPMQWVDPSRAQMQGKAPVSQHLGGYGAYGSMDQGRPKTAFGAFY